MQMHLQDQIFLERMSSSKEVRIGTSQNNSSNLLETFALRLDQTSTGTQKHGIVKRKKGTLQFCLLIWVACIILFQEDSSRERLLPSTKKLSLPIKHLFQRVFLSFFRAKIIYLTNKKTSSFFEISLDKKTCCAILTLNNESDKNAMHGFHGVFLTLDTLGTKSFGAWSNFLIFSVHNLVIKNTSFQHSPRQPPF